MDYTHIHGKIITTTHSLKLIPTAQLEGVLGQFATINSLVREMQHQAITVVVHAFMASGLHRYDTVCTVLVDNVPAFFFHTTKGPDEEYADCYVLHAPAYREYVRYVLEMVEDAAIGYVEEVTHEDIPSLSRMETRWSPYTQYGTAYIRYQDVEGSNYWPNPYEEDTAGVGLQHHLTLVHPAK
jgi:hypothetical protein